MSQFSVGAPPPPPFSTGPLPPPPGGPKRGSGLGWVMVLGAVALVVVLLAVVLINRDGVGSPGVIAPTSDTAVATTLANGSTPTTRQPGNPAAMSSCAMQTGLIRRECEIAAPPDEHPGERLPVVILIPGLGVGPAGVRNAGDWSNAVVRHRLLVVTPQGIADSWNAGGCCLIAQATGVDDIDYLTRVIDLVAARPDVDAARIFMTGFSNGGMMTYRFLCSPAASRLAAAASVSGTDVAGCDPSRSLPFEHIHGTGDQVVPYRGGNSLAGLILNVSFPSVPSSVEKFAAADGCHGTPATSTVGGVAFDDWAGCGNGSRVRLATIPGWGHDWPGGGSFSATDELLRFFGISG